jgi:hypothetical protein
MEVDAAKIAFLFITNGINVVLGWSAILVS